jgi:restriction system-associated AAA family ATPase
MKLIRLKITDPAGFRSLPCGFEHHFRSEWSLQDELTQPEGFAPFVCAGPNGSGKSNLLEVLAAIFFQLEILRVRRSFLPEVLQDKNQDFSPMAFELDYLIRVPPQYLQPNGPVWARVSVFKETGDSVRFLWENQSDFATDGYEIFKGGHADILLPQYVLAYSSGENEILSLPFFKMRFVQFDEYSNALAKQLPYPGYPDTRLAYLDNSFSQAILLCNLLLQDETTLQPFREDVGIEALREFRIIIRRSIPIAPEQLETFDLASDGERKERLNRIRSEHPRATDTERRDLLCREIVRGNPALWIEETDQGSLQYRLNLMHLLEADERLQQELKEKTESDRDHKRSSAKYQNFDPAITRLKRCATLTFEDEATDTLILDYWVNEQTKQAFRENFDFEENHSPLALFQAFQVLLALNLYVVSDALKDDLYRSTSNYAIETVPILASDQRIMRFKFVRFSKQGVAKPMMLKELSDGEHQLLHSLGLCLLFRETNSLFLLDEPETHFNPDWRANFISRLRQCLPENGSFGQEMLLTTHTPFLISDSKPDKVLVFAKDKASGAVSISHPDYNTLGASINKITMNTFGKRETIGGHAQAMLEDLRRRFEEGIEDKEALITEIHQQLGDSIEKLLLIKAILDGEQILNGEAKG